MKTAVTTVQGGTTMAKERIPTGFGSGLGKLGGTPRWAPGVPKTDGQHDGNIVPSDHAPHHHKGAQFQGTLRDPHDLNEDAPNSYFPVCNFPSSDPETPWSRAIWDTPCPIQLKPRAFLGKWRCPFRGQTPEDCQHCGESGSH